MAGSSEQRVVLHGQTPKLSNMNPSTARLTQDGLNELCRGFRMSL